MAITGEQLNSKLGILLQDSNVQWTKEEVCGWINSAQREILIYKPNANPFYGNIPTVIGTKQNLPAGAIQLLDITCNMGTAGTTRGKIITAFDRAILDRTMSSWQKPSSYVSASIGADHYTYDQRFPTVFYLYPGLTAASNVEGSYSRLPTDLTYATGTITGSIFNDIYETQILDYCGYRCHMKDTESPTSLAKSANFFQAFSSSLTAKSTGETTFSTTPSIQETK